MIYSNYIKSKSDKYIYKKMFTAINNFFFGKQIEIANKCDDELNDLTEPDFKVYIDTLESHNLYEPQKNENKRCEECVRSIEKSIDMLITKDIPVAMPMVQLEGNNYVIPVLVVKAEGKVKNPFGIQGTLGEVAKYHFDIHIENMLDKINKAKENGELSIRYEIIVEFKYKDCWCLLGNLFKNHDELKQYIIQLIRPYSKMCNGYVVNNLVYLFKLS